MDFTAGQKLTALKMNQVLQARCYAYQIVTQTITTATITEITFTAEAATVDPFGFHSTSVNPSRITPTIPGTYRCTGQVCWMAETSGDRTAQIYKNGVAVDTLPYRGQRAMQGTGLSFGFSDCEGVVTCNGTTDYITLNGTHNRGSDLDTAYSAGGSNSFLLVERIGD